MTIAERAVGGVIVLDLDGQLSFGDTAACLREHLDSLLARDETRIILNLGRLSTMDSSGLGEILRGQRMFQQQGGDLRLVGVAANVHRTLEMTRVDSRLPTFDSEEVVVASFDRSTDGQSP